MLLAIQVNGSALLFLLISLFEFLFVLPVVIYTRKKKLNFSEYLKSILYKSVPAKFFLLFIALSIAIAFMMIFIAPLIIFIQQQLIVLVFGISALQDAISNLNIFNIVSTSVFDVIIYAVTSFLTIALNEELFFRGFISTILQWSSKKKIFFSSILFGVYHLLTTFNIYSMLYMFFYYFLWGIVLALEFHACKNQLIFPVVTHGLFNFLLFLL